jgi:hypothetical protein
MIPVALGRLGVLASVMWVVELPLQIVGALPDSATGFVYLPLVVFEISVGLWLLVKGVGMPPAHNVSPRPADSPL